MKEYKHREVVEYQEYRDGNPRAKIRYAKFTGRQYVIEIEIPQYKYKCGSPTVNPFEFEDWQEVYLCLPRTSKNPHKEWICTDDYTCLLLGFIDQRMPIDEDGISTLLKSRRGIDRLGQKILAIMRDTNEIDVGDYLSGGDWDDGEDSQYLLAGDDSNDSFYYSGDSIISLVDTLAMVARDKREWDIRREIENGQLTFWPYPFNFN